MDGSRRALVVANFDYLEPALRRLRAPPQDAESLANVLRDTAIGGFQVSCLLNENSSTVSMAIEEFFRFSNPKPDDLLLFYFSGHGITDEDGRLYFATSDTRFAGQSVRGASAVSAEFVSDVLRRSRSRRQVVILDCCYSGAFADAMRGKGNEVGAARHFQGEGRMVLAAAGARQVALESQIKDGASMPSVYTRILVEGLTTGEADQDGDGLVNLDELHDYLLGRVAKEAPGQTPSKSGYVEGQLYIASTPVVRPAPLPHELRNALENPLPLVREAAVQSLYNLLRGGHRGLDVAAREALAGLADDDSLRVRRAAERCLADYGGISKPEAKTDSPRPNVAAAEPAARRSAAPTETERLERERQARQRTEAAERTRREREVRDRLARERAAANEREQRARDPVVDRAEEPPEYPGLADDTGSRFSEAARIIRMWFWVIAAFIWSILWLGSMADPKPVSPLVAFPFASGGAAVGLWRAQKNRRKP